MEPAASIIKALGGPNKVAEITGVHRTRVWNWTRPRKPGAGKSDGTGGLIPHRHHAAILRAARAQQIDLTAESFFRPGELDAA